MGTCHFSFPGFFSCFFVFWAYAACLYPSMHHNAIASLHENHKASKVGQEKEKKDASSIIYLELLEAWISLKGTKFCGANLRFIDHCIRTTHALVYFKYLIVAEASWRRNMNRITSKHGLPRWTWWLEIESWDVLLLHTAVSLKVCFLLTTFMLLMQGSEKLYCNFNPSGNILNNICFI